MNLSMDIIKMRQFLLKKTHTINNFASLFKPVGRASESVMGPNVKLVELLKMSGAGLGVVCCLVIRGSTFPPVFQWFFNTLWTFRCHNTLFLSSPHL